jgi:hypothetical protein
VINAVDRHFFREQALATWQETKRLRRDAELLRLLRSSEDWGATADGHGSSRPRRMHQVALRDHAPPTRERSQTVSARANQLVADVTLWFQASVGPQVLEDLVDHAIGKSRVPHSAEWGRGAALVASGDLGELRRLRDLVAMRMPSVVDAVDAGTALGLAISTQPDLAVVDARLGLGSGVDVALTFRTYAPRTRALVLTDEPDRAADVRTVGFDAENRNIPEPTLLAWIARAAA